MHSFTPPPWKYSGERNSALNHHIYSKDRPIANLSAWEGDFCVGNGHLMSAAPNLYIANLLRDAIEELTTHSAEGGQYEVAFNTAKRLCEETGFVFDNWQNSQWKNAQLKEFVQDYTKRAMEKANGEQK